MKTDTRIYHSDQEGLLDVKSKRAGISEKNLASALAIVSERLYTNPISAFIREITSNCIDAHKDLGIDRDVEVMIEQEDEEIFVTFRDFGKGMSNSFMESVYLQYFDSTKKDSDELIGGFGIGSKSPFAYTDSFYIETQSKGDETLRKYLFYKDEQGIPSLILESEEYRNESEHGTKIRVPVNNKEDIKLIKSEGKKAMFLFSGITSNFFESPLADPNSYTNTENYIFFSNPDEEVLNITSRYNRGAYDMSTILYISIGDVLYAIPTDKITSRKEFLLLITKIRGMILKFRIDELEPNPSREAILLTEASITKLVNKAKLVILEILWSLNAFVKSTNIKVSDCAGTKNITFDTAEEMKFLKSFSQTTYFFKIEFNEQDIIIPKSIVEMIAEFVHSKTKSSEAYNIIRHYEDSITEDLYDSWKILKYLSSNNSNAFLYRGFSDFVEENKSQFESINKVSLSRFYVLYLIYSDAFKIHKQFSEKSTTYNYLTIDEINKFIADAVNFEHYNPLLDEVYEKPNYLDFAGCVVFDKDLDSNKNKKTILEFFDLDKNPHYGSEKRFPYKFARRIQLFLSGKYSHINSNFEYNRTTSHPPSVAIDVDQFINDRIDLAEVDRIIASSKTFIYSYFEKINYAKSAKERKSDFTEKLKDSLSKIYPNSRIVDSVIKYYEILPENLYISGNLIAFISGEINQSRIYNFSKHEDYSLKGTEKYIKEFINFVSALPSDITSKKRFLENKYRVKIEKISALNLQTKIHFRDKYGLKNLVDYLYRLCCYNASKEMELFSEKVSNKYKSILGPSESISLIEKLCVEIKDSLEKKYELYLESEKANPVYQKYQEEKEERVRKQKVDIQNTKIRYLYLANRSKREVELRSEKVDNPSTLDQTIDRLKNKYPETGLMLYCRYDDRERLKEFVEKCQYIYSSYSFNGFCVENGKTSVQTDRILVLTDEQLEYARENCEFKNYFVHFDEFLISIHPFFSMSVYRQIKQEELIMQTAHFSEFVKNPAKDFASLPTKNRFNLSMLSYPSDNNSLFGTTKNVLFNKDERNVFSVNPNIKLIHDTFRKVFDTFDIITKIEHTPFGFSNDHLFKQNSVLSEMLSFGKNRVDYSYFRMKKNSYLEVDQPNNSYSPVYNADSVYENVKQCREFAHFFIIKDRGYFYSRYNENQSCCEVTSKREKNWTLDYTASMTKLYHLYKMTDKVLQEFEFEDSRIVIENFLELSHTLSYETYLYFLELGKIVNDVYKGIDEDMKKYSRFLFNNVCSSPYTNKLYQRLVDKYLKKQEQVKVIVSERYLKGFGKDVQEFVKKTFDKILWQYDKKQEEYVFYTKHIYIPNLDPYTERKGGDFVLENDSVLSKVKSKASSFIIEEHFAKSVFHNIKIADIEIKSYLKKYQDLKLPLKEGHALVYPLVAANSVQRSLCLLDKESRINQVINSETPCEYSWQNNQSAKVKIFDLKGLDLKKEKLKALKIGERHPYLKKVISDKDVFYNIKDISELRKDRESLYIANTNYLFDYLKTIPQLEILKNGKI